MNESGSNPRPSAFSRFLRILLTLLGLGVGAIVVAVPLSLEKQAIFGAIVFVIALVLGRVGGRLGRMILVAFSIIVSSRYIFWRLTSTLALGTTLEFVLGTILLSAELYAFIVLILGYVQASWPLCRKPIPLPEDTDAWPSVDIFIPTYNEPLEVVRGTVLAARTMDWPEDKLFVWILDDGNREEFAEFAAEAGVSYVSREDNEHAKAGNINNALKQASGDYVTIFDCDHVPTRSFLQMTMGIMVKDPSVAMVQTPHHFNSPDPFERNLETFRKIPNEGELFYGLLMKGNDLWNAVFFCGSCAVMRRTALDEIGGIAVETVTEDAHTGLRFHRRGHKTVFYDFPQASGLATESLSAHVGQRIRWARGMVQIFRIDNPLIKRGLQWGQRLCYMNSMIHFLNGGPRLVFLVAPLAFLYFGINIFNAAALLVLAYALPHLAHSTMTSSRLQGRVRHSFWAEVYETVLATYVWVPTTLALINPKLGKFNVTAKGGLVDKPYFDSKIALPYIILLLLNLGGIGVGIWRLMDVPNPNDSVTINIAWAVYNVIVLFAAVAVAYETRQRRRASRIEVEVPGMLRLPSGHTITCETRDLARAGAAVQASARVPMEAGEELHLSLFLGREEVCFPCRLAFQRGPTLGLEFEDLTVAQEEGLVRAAYSRADAWCDWGQTVQRDRPLRSAARILKHALTGIPRMFAGGRRPTS